MEEGALGKVETKDGDFYLFLRQLGEKENGFELNVTDCCSTWASKVTQTMIQEMAGKVEMDVDAYLSQTIHALTGNNYIGKENFIYQVIQEETTLEFSWKKQLDDGVKFNLGSILLTQSGENKMLMKNIFDFAIRKLHEYKDIVGTMKSEMEHLATDKDNAVKRLEKCIVGKEEMELDLFQKFVTVLNDKKAKIRRLQETIEQHLHAPAVAAEPAQKPASTNSKDDTMPLKTGDNDTDTETDEAQSNNGSEEKGTSSNFGSCLFQDDGESAPIMKRRNKRAQKSVRTSSKPVSPKVTTSVKRTASNASSTSTNSDESKQTPTTRRSKRNKQSPILQDNVEDLFEDMA